MSLFLVLKFIHIFAAITAVGMNISYGIWLGRVGNEPSHSAFTLKTIKFIDDRIANPLYGLLLLTGMLMVLTSGISLLQLWIEVALVLWLALILVGLFAYTPTLRAQVKLAEAGDVSSVEFGRLTTRGAILGAVTGVIVFVILIMMVFKPHL
jgi:uncharacterized membrane protein